MSLERAFILLFDKAREVFSDITSPADASIDDSSELYLGLSPKLYHPARTEPFYLLQNERAKHLYICGGSGMGKSNFIFNLIRQDILQRNGFGLIDAHGDLVSQILNLIANLVKENKLTMKDLKKLVLLDPSFQEVSVGFNPLECESSDKAYGQVLEMMSIFRKIWKDVSWGARMDELMRATLYTLAEKELTLLEAPRLLTDQVFRQELTQNLHNPEISDYWHSRFESLSDKMQAVYREPVLNKISILLASPELRLMLGHRKSSVNFRKAMDEGKWVLINLSKGKLKENAFLLGGLFGVKLYQAALSRTDIDSETRRPFYLYIDEFQNFAGDGFIDTLSESRKYGLSLTLANQNLSQLDRELLSSIFANASTHVYFRLSPQDARYVSSEFSDEQSRLFQSILADLEVGQAILRRKGEPSRLLKTAYQPEKRASQEALENIITSALNNFGMPKANLLADIEKRSNRTSNQAVKIVESNKRKHSIVISQKDELLPKVELHEGLEEGE